MDAFHLVEAAKWGSFFVTLDRRISKKSADIEAVLPGLWIVSPTELLAIFDRHAVGREQAARAMVGDGVRESGEY